MEILNTLLTMPGHEIVTLLGYMTMVSVVVDKAGAVIEVMIKRHKEAKIRRMKEKAEIIQILCFLVRVYQFSFDFSKVSQNGV